MKAKLKSATSPDIDPESYWPEDESDFGFWLEVEIGPDDEDGADVFGLQICSPRWIEKNIGTPTFLHGYLVVTQYDFGAILETVAELCARQEGKTWDEVARGLSRYARWEYDGYSG